MVGTTRSRISYFINRLKLRGILHGPGNLTVSTHEIRAYIDAPERRSLTA